MNDIFNKLLYNKEQANKKPTLIYKYYDNVAKEINTKIRMRGISKGFICVQYVTYNQIKMKFEKGINYGYLRNNY